MVLIKMMTIELKERWAPCNHKKKEADMDKAQIAARYPRLAALVAQGTEKAKAEFESLLEGIRTLGILEHHRENRDQFRKLTETAVECEVQMYDALAAMVELFNKPLLREEPPRPPEEEGEPPTTEQPQPPS